MRPIVPDAFASYSRKPSLTELSGSPSLTEPQHAGPPETFFLTRENNMADSPVDVSDTVRDSTYGVQSLEETLNESADPLEMEQANEPGESSHVQPSQNDHPALRRMSTIRPARPRALDLSHSPSRPSRTTLSPLVLSSPAEPISFPSSPKSTSTRSLRPSEEISLPDETPEVASEDEERRPRPQSRSQIDDSIPQLIMPSIRMPSRRPFTERGKVMGRLKVMVAGGPGMLFPPLSRDPLWLNPVV